MEAHFPKWKSTEITKTGRRLLSAGLTNEQRKPISSLACYDGRHLCSYGTLSMPASDSAQHDARTRNTSTPETHTAGLDIDKHQNRILSPIYTFFSCTIRLPPDYHFDPQRRSALLYSVHPQEPCLLDHPHSTIQTKKQTTPHQQNPSSHHQPKSLRTSLLQRVQPLKQQSNDTPPRVHLEAGTSSNDVFYQQLIQETRHLRQSRFSVRTLKQTDGGQPCNVLADSPDLLD